MPAIPAMQQQALMAFLFMDECWFDPLDLAALTGVLIPSEVYNSVRDAMCQITWDVLTPPANVVPAPVELHGSDLLSDVTDRDTASLDAARLHVFEAVVKIVNRHDVQIYRVAYLNRSEIAAHMAADGGLYGLNFFGIERMLQKELEKYLILPVMDGIPAASPRRKQAPQINPMMLRAFDQHVRWIHHARCHPKVVKNISIENARNLAEPVFADSEHSTLIQLADLVSYLLLQREKAELASPPSSDFSRDVLRIASTLRDELVHTCCGRLELDRRYGD